MGLLSAKGRQQPVGMPAQPGARPGGMPRGLHCQIGLTGTGSLAARGAWLNHYHQRRLALASPPDAPGLREVPCLVFRSAWLPNQRRLAFLSSQRHLAPCPARDGIRPTPAARVDSFPYGQASTLASGRACCLGNTPTVSIASPHAYHAPTFPTTPRGEGERRNINENKERKN